MKEVWKDVEDYEGLYQVSNFGNLYSNYVKRNLQLSLDEYGYKQVILVKNGVIYRSTREASRLLGLDNGSLNKVLKGKRKTVGGFTFKYKED